VLHVLNSAKIAARNIPRTWMFAPAAVTAWTASGYHPLHGMLPPAADELCGVTGWLLFFCISLTFFAPVTQAFVAAKTLRNLATARVPIQALLRLGSVGGLYACLAVFSSIAGVMLWMEKPRRVNVAQAYLLVAALGSISLYISFAPRRNARSSGSGHLWAACLFRGLVLLSGGLLSGEGHLRHFVRRSSNVTQC
jgi:hypothetical protein